MSLDYPTRLDAFRLSVDYVTQRSARLDPSQATTEGSDLNIILGSTSIVAASVINQLAEKINGLLLDGAEGEDLDRFAFDRYSLSRKGASPALGSVRIFRMDATFGAGTIPAGTVLSTLTGINYITTTVATLGALDLETSANVRAVEASKATQVTANSIVRFANPPTLFDRTLQVNNDEATAGGEDIEDDETFRNRIRQFWRTARRGVLEAIEFGALTVPGVVSAQAIEALTTGNTPARVVNLYIADSSGVASETLADTVRVALDDYRAGGIAVIVSTSLPFIVDITLKLSFKAGTDTVTLSDNVRAAVVEFINSLAVNGTLYIAQLYTVLQRFEADGVIVSQDSIVSPTGDLVPDVGQTLRTTTENVVLT